MNIWSFLGQLAQKKVPAVTATLLQASGEQGRLAGLMAAAEKGGRFRGPLTQAPFWASDLIKLSELLEFLPEIGRLREIEGRLYYLAPLSYNRAALVLGGGHVGQALAGLLRFLDFEVTLADDRPEFLAPRQDGTKTVEASFTRLGELFSSERLDALVIVTRGHAQDTICLRQVLSWERIPPYLGMIGSRRRTLETLKMLASEGFDQALLAEVHTPVGLKIGAQTPAEIAVSIGAEIIQVLNQAPAS